MLAPAAPPMEGGGLPLPFLGLGRVQDGVVLATLSLFERAPDGERTQEAREVEGIFKKLLDAARIKLKHGERCRLSFKSGSVCCLMDQDGFLLFCVFTASIEYPENLTTQLNRELQTLAMLEMKEDLERMSEGALSEKMKAPMEALIAKYAHPNEADLENAQTDRSNSVVNVSIMESTPPKRGRTVLSVVAVISVFFAIGVIGYLIYTFTQNEAEVALEMLE